MACLSSYCRSVLYWKKTEHDLGSTWNKKAEGLNGGFGSECKTCPKRIPLSNFYLFLTHLKMKCVDIFASDLS